LAISVISRVEVLGCHKLTDRDRSFFEAFFAVLEILPITDGVLDRAIALRQARKMSLGDAIIAATALVFGRELKTHNLRDFSGIPDLLASDPLAAI